MTSASIDRVEALLKAFAADHGIDPLDFDEDGLTALMIGEVEVFVGYSEGRESCFFLGALAADDRRVAPMLESDLAILGPPRRQCLMVRDPASGEDVLLAEHLIDTLSPAEISTQLVAFAGELTLLQAGAAAQPSDLPRDLFQWIRP
jgi:hypothetical protein